MQESLNLNVNHLFDWMEKVFNKPDNNENLEQKEKEAEIEHKDFSSLNVDVCSSNNDCPQSHCCIRVYNSELFPQLSKSEADAVRKVYGESHYCLNDSHCADPDPVPEAGGNSVAAVFITLFVLMLCGAGAFAFYRYRYRANKTTFISGAQPQDTDAEKMLNDKDVSTQDSFSEELTPGDSSQGKKYQVNDA